MNIVVPDKRRAFITELTSQLAQSRKRCEKPFLRMRADMDFVFGFQHAGQTDLDDPRYVANLVRRQINLRVAALYAKNPTMVAQRVPRMDFMLWDEKLQTLQMMQQRLQAGQPPGPEDIALLQDVQQGMQFRSTVNRMGQSLTLFMGRQIDQLTPSFKLLAKQFIRRILTVGVGYWELSFQQENGYDENTAARIVDARQQLSNMRRLVQEIGEQGDDPDARQVDELEVALAALEANPAQILRQGLVHDLPSAFDIIPDRHTRSIKGWVGTRVLARKYHITKGEVYERYGVDLKSSYTAYRGDSVDLTTTGMGLPATAMGEDNSDFVCVYRAYHKPDGVVYTLCEGYEDFLEPPAPPVISVPQFFPIYGLTFNDDEHDRQLFPLSDARIMRHPQRERNKKREAAKQHRHANRPLYLSPAGAFDADEDKELQDYPAHTVLKVNALKEGQKASELIQPLAKSPMDPALYETDTEMGDILSSTGAQEANLGPTSGATATETSIAENSRSASINLAIDDFDDLLSLLFRDMGAVAMTKFSPDYVKSQIGPGAVWPDDDAERWMALVQLKIEAGSSGKPNAAQQAALFERLAPYLMQVPGISPEWLAKTAVRLVDDRVDLTEALLYGMPSITALNGQMQASTGNPETDPNAQAQAGAANQPSAQLRPPGPQPGYPGGGVGVSGIANAA